MGAREVEHGALEDSAFGAHLPEAGRDHDRGRDPGRCHVAQGVEDVHGRHRDDGQVDPFGKVGEPRTRDDPGHDVTARVDHVQCAGIPAGHDGAHDCGTDAGAVASYAGHGDASGVEQGCQRLGLGVALAGISRSNGALRGRDAQFDTDGPGLDLACDLEAGSEKDAEHGAVLGEYLRDEAPDPKVAAGGGEMLQEEAAEPSAVLFLIDQESDLGRVDRDRLGRAERDDAVADRHDQAGDGGVRRIEEVLDIVVPGLAADAEEPHAPAGHRCAFVQCCETLVVAWTYASDDRHRPVTEQDVRVQGKAGVHRARRGWSYSAWLRSHESGTVYLRLSVCRSILRSSATVQQGRWSRVCCHDGLGAPGRANRCQVRAVHMTAQATPMA